MAKTAFNIQVVSGTAGYTFPAGKYAVYNLQLSYNNNSPQKIYFNMFMAPLINGNQFAYILYQRYHRMGPLVANAGDVLTLLPYGTSGSLGLASNPNTAALNPAVMGVSGFSYDISPNKTPVNVFLDANAATYTVPAGKYAIFNLYYVDSEFVLTVNGVAVAATSTANQDAENAMGPFAANAGDVIGLIYMPGLPSTKPVNCRAYLSGFLKNVGT